MCRDERFLDLSHPVDMGTFVILCFMFSPVILIIGVFYVIGKITHTILKLFGVKL